MKIWLHVNGHQEGPFTLEELPLDILTPDTPVWYDGLDDWKPASEAEVTAALVNREAAFIDASNQESVTESFVGEANAAFDPWAKVEKESPTPASTQPTPFSAPQSSAAETPEMPSAPPQPGQVPPPMPMENQCSNPPQPYMMEPPACPPQMPQGQMPQGDFQNTPMQMRPKCPPDYMVWGIITLLLCCSLPGIIVVINAVRINNRFKKGDLMGAQKLSQTNEWWAIISIVCGIVFYPFIAILQLATL